MRKREITAWIKRHGENPIRRPWSLDSRELASLEYQRWREQYEFGEAELKRLHGTTTPEQQNA